MAHRAKLHNTHFNFVGRLTAHRDMTGVQGTGHPYRLKVSVGLEGLV